MVAANATARGEEDRVAINDEERRKKVGGAKGLLATSFVLFSVFFSSFVLCVLPPSIFSRSACASSRYLYNTNDDSIAHCMQTHVISLTSAMACLYCLGH